jgi:hypothetical protein
LKGISLRLASSVAVVSGLLAQTSTQAPAQIKVTTRLVLLNVLVHDRSGRPVGDLSKTDFAVTDAGRPQTISLFSVDQLAPGPAGAPPATTLPRNIVTNRPRNAVWSPLDSTKLAITARIDPSPALPNASRFSFAIDPAGVDFQQKDGKYRSQVDVLFVQQRKGGEHAAELKKTLTIAVTPERYEEMRANRVILTEDLKIHLDTVAVRIIVVDHSCGAAGSVTVVVGAEDKSGANGIPAAGPTAPH